MTIIADDRRHLNVFWSATVSVPILHACKAIESQEVYGSMLAKSLSLSYSMMWDEKHSTAETFAKIGFSPDIVDIKISW